MPRSSADKREAGSGDTHRCQQVHFLHKRIQERLTLFELTLALDSLSVQFSLESVVISTKLSLASWKSALNCGNCPIYTSIEISSSSKQP